jgi:hypothetical protein
VELEGLSSFKNAVTSLEIGTGDLPACRIIPEKNCMCEKLRKTILKEIRHHILRRIPKRNVKKCKIAFLS